MLAYKKIMLANNFANNIVEDVPFSTLHGLHVSIERSIESWINMCNEKNGPSTKLLPIQNCFLLLIQQHHFQWVERFAKNNLLFQSHPKSNKSQINK
jgi:hypothetical protein